MKYEEIVSALNSGKIVHWRNSGYTVIKHSLEGYVNLYIVWDLLGPKQNFVGLSEFDFQGYDESEFYIERKIAKIKIGFSELGKEVRISSEFPKDVFEHLNGLDRRYNNQLGYFKTNLEIIFQDGDSFKFRFDIGDGLGLDWFFDKHFPKWEF